MRIKRLKKNLAKKGAFPFLVTNLTNVSYLTGFRGTYGNLLVDEDRVIFITDSRYEEYAMSILPEGVDFLLQTKNLIDTIKDALKSIKKKRLYVEPLLDMAGFLSIKKELKGLKVEPGEDEVQPLRTEKDDEEIETIRKAVAIADDCFRHLTKIAKPGMLEWDLAIEIENFYRKNGCRKSAFDSIVASGRGSSMPHYATSMTKRIEPGDILLVDMGCEYNGYNSDLTRTIFMGNITAEFKRIYNIVKEAQQAAISSVRPGITAGSLDKTARRIIEKEGYGKNFGHGLGHGIGLDVHEAPSLKTGNKFKLKKNCVFTIEPGIYIQDSGGVRIEDIVVATGNGYEILTGSSKDMIII